MSSLKLKAQSIPKMAIWRMCHVGIVERGLGVSDVIQDGYDRLTKQIEALKAQIKTLEAERQPFEDKLTQRELTPYGLTLGERRIPNVEAQRLMRQRLEEALDYWSAQSYDLALPVSVVGVGMTYEETVIEVLHPSRQRFYLAVALVQSLEKMP